MANVITLTSAFARNIYEYIFQDDDFSVPALAPGAVSRRVWPCGVSWLVQGVMSMHCDSWDKVYGCVWWE